MRFDEPAWWYGPPDAPAARCLAPAAWLWQRATEYRWLRVKPHRSARPVVCVGNFTVGGTGKTPLAGAIAQKLAALGRTPVILSRGYGGRLAGPHWVDAARDGARDVGDEPLLHAVAYPVLISRDRSAGAMTICARGVAGDVIVMDDGLQNPSLVKDLAIAVVDGRRGLGNGRVLPAGPLRASLAFQMPLVDAIVVVLPGGGAGYDESRLREQLKVASRPVLMAHIAPVGPPVGPGPFVAWAGIGAPQRFFNLLRAQGATISREITFPDHHMPTQDEARELLQTADRLGAGLVTTRKDFVRVRGGPGALDALATASRTLDIALSLSAGDDARLTALLRALADPDTLPSVRTRLRG